MEWLLAVDATDKSPDPRVIAAARAISLFLALVAVLVFLIS